MTTNVRSSVCLSYNVFYISVDVILCFTPHIVESKAENYKKHFIVKFRQSLRNYSILKMVRFFLRSVYIPKKLCRSDCMERKRSLDFYCTKLRKFFHSGTFTVELLLLGGQPEGKLAAIFSLPSRNKKWWNYKADRRCHKISACKVFRSNPPSILYTTRNIAVPNSRDIRQFSSSQRRVNGTGFASTSLFG